MFSHNAITARRGGRVNREEVPEFSHKCHVPVVVPVVVMLRAPVPLFSHKCHFAARRVAALIVRAVPAKVAQICPFYALMPSLRTRRRPVVVMLRAPVPFFRKMPCPPVVWPR